MMKPLVETAATLLKHRAGDAKPEDLLWFLDNAATEPSGPGDEIASDRVAPGHGR